MLNIKVVYVVVVNFADEESNLKAVEYCELETACPFKITLLILYYKIGQYDGYLFVNLLPSCKDF